MNIQTGSMKRRMAVAMALGLMTCCLASPPAWAQSESAATPAKSPSKLETLTKGMKKVEGLWTAYHNDQKLYVLLKSSDLSREYLVVTSIARGISTGDVLGGYSWGFGDDALWSFRKVGEKIHVLRKNVRFRAKKGSPEAQAVALAYGDSVLYALPVLTPAGGGYLVDMTRIFMSDDQGIGSSIGFSFASDRSTWAKVKAFPRNIELQVAAVYSGRRRLDTVADSRGVQVNVHYSISTLNSTGYKPRAADDRVGYFLTVAKDFSSDDDPEHFVRYINRWDLQKEDTSAKLSRPKNPIRFYVSKTVPRELRPYVQEGIEEWNKAFEKLGFYKAIEVFQQREEDDWDPEDVRYNTFRWITAEAGFAMGPSRVNPRTGQILDADIIFDASFLRYWSQEYETFTPEVARRLILRPDNPGSTLANPTHSSETGSHLCRLSHGMQQQMGFSAAVLMARGLTTAEGKLPVEFIQQALKEVVMHEVGHTLGLRHNFKASAWKSLKDIDNLDKGRSEGIVASVMDYAPANIAPDKDKQGLYYTQTIGPYDYWAIEYGYKPISGDEQAELNKIASRSGEAGHDYATDEDTRSVDADPLTNRFDLGSSPIEFSERQMKLAAELLPEVVDRAAEDGKGYQRVRQMFGMLFSEYWRAAAFAARFPGGVLVHRDHRGDKDARPPFKVVDSSQQRQAMKLLAQTAFGSHQYEPDTLNYLAASRWNHWGTRSVIRLDYPIHDNVLMMQEMMLFELLSSNRLQRMLDNELKVKDDDVYTLAEHLRLVIEPIFEECLADPKNAKFTNRKPYISSFRRNLQRASLKQLSRLVAYGSSYPDDARTLSRMHLKTLHDNMARLLGHPKLQLDDYSRAHLIDSQNRIKQVLEAGLQLPTVN